MPWAEKQVEWSLWTLESISEKVGVVNWQAEVDGTYNVLEAEEKSSHYFLERSLEREKLEGLSAAPFVLYISMGS